MAVRQRRGGHPHSRAASSRPNPGSARMMAATASLPFLRPPGLRRAVPASCPLPLAPAVPSGPRQQARLGPADRMLLRQGPSPSAAPTRTGSSSSPYRRAAPEGRRGSQPREAQDGGLPRGGSCRRVQTLAVGSVRWPLAPSRGRRGQREEIGAWKEWCHGRFVSPSGGVTIAILPAPWQ